ncbi:thiol-disulfide oxidoreductase DCC family protein [Phycisphaerales bacterium AB-hyl4]|uniref:Thiol-disulfide oxidoreductase DCC family protein n=1 Tax=Natronomicrosphaera hydrolytica TaxID=3242702 RepID=A0ABV4U539_9BACT
MANGWTGGQYSLVRVLTAAIVAVVVGSAIAAGGVVQILVGLMLLMLAAAFAVGWRGREVTVALTLGLLLLTLLLDYPRVWESLAVLGPMVLVVMLAVHARLAWAGPTPYGSLDARGRLDPGGEWQFPSWLFRRLWLAMGLVYVGGGVLLLRDEAWRLAEALFYDDGQWAVLPWVGTMPEWLGRGLTWLLLGTWLAFGPLALSRRNRRLAWSLTLGVNLLVLPLAGYWALALALTAVHLLAFNPLWLPARPRSQPSTPPATVYYDGHCGLCHRWVRFVLAEDVKGEQFVLSPLDSEHFREHVSAAQRETLPDSIIVRRGDGELLVQSAAVLYILDRLGGLWRVAAMLGQALPAPLCDAVYSQIAAVRRRLFAQPTDACPMMPPTLRARFRI